MTKRKILALGEIKFMIEAMESRHTVTAIYLAYRNGARKSFNEGNKSAGRKFVYLAKVANKRRIELKLMEKELVWEF